MTPPAFKTQQQIDHENAYEFARRLKVQEDLNDNLLSALERISEVIAFEIKQLKDGR